MSKTNISFIYIFLLLLGSLSSFSLPPYNFIFVNFITYSLFLYLIILFKEKKLKILNFFFFRFYFWLWIFWKWPLLGIALINFWYAVNFFYSSCHIRPAYSSCCFLRSCSFCHSFIYKKRLCFFINIFHFIVSFWIFARNIIDWIFLEFNILFMEFFTWEYSNIKIHWHIYF